MTSVLRSATISARLVIHPLFCKLLLGKLVPWACDWGWLQCIEAYEQPSEPLVLAEAHSEISVASTCVSSCEREYITKGDTASASPTKLHTISQFLAVHIFTISIRNIKSQAELANYHKFSAIIAVLSEHYYLS